MPSYGSFNQEPSSMSKTSEPAEHHRASTIGFWAGVCLLANNITGPGMVDIPNTFQAAGWLFPTVAFLFTAVYSVLVCILLARALSNVPGNGHFQKQLEFSKLASDIFSRKVYLFLIVTLIVVFQCSNMSAIVESAQTMDSTLLSIFGTTCALVLHSPDLQKTAYLSAFEATGCPNSEVSSSALSEWQAYPNHGLEEMFMICNLTASGKASPDQYQLCCGPACASPPTCRAQKNWDQFAHPSAWQCRNRDHDNVITNSVFGNDYVISLGFIVVMLVTIPIGFFDLESNMWVQVLGFCLLAYCYVAWIVQFFVFGFDVQNLQPLQIKGSGSVLANVVFNFGYVVTIPSWLNEKQPHVNAFDSIIAAVMMAAVMFLSLGIMGAASDIDFSSADLLASISTDPRAGWYSKLAVYLFPPAALLTGIPVFSIIIRYNLMESKLCGHAWANFIAVLANFKHDGTKVVLPWGLALFFYTGNLLTDLINWSSALVFALLNFTFPLLVYALSKYPDKDDSDGGMSDFSHALLTESSRDDDEKEVLDLPVWIETACCHQKGRKLAWFLIYISVFIGIATLVFQILDPQ